MKNLLLIAVSAALGTAAVKSQTLAWGNELGGKLADSSGSPLDISFTFELGSFASGFVPTEQNASAWLTNWIVFDRAQFNPVFGYFTSEVQMLPDGTSGSTWATPGAESFEGLDAYFFVRKGEDAVPGTEWFLAHAPFWVFPTAFLDDCCPTAPPTLWAVSDLEDAVPVFGSQNGVAGGGTGITLQEPAHLQTFTFVPEPGTVLLAMLGLSAVFRRRR